ncbi:PHD finger protein 21Aa isoform X1 [Neoarius graeffei]|uniref:PHD finger protein 21Aa isoform X1 n=1 Tax=Neoarius graeffei TaxID=443677 RepID=UPI00298C8F51|nr:PHD finger protein 21Aa isoform X1 [Neoarius graeffei]XP_060767867.1 PHD finger protein 21Aa isoform X1 [Neoarius graeffei]
MVFKTAVAVKAEGGVEFGQKGLMMELQSLQEALKVEIQIHQKLVAQMKQDPQNAELKLQLHDLQAKITVLSERQKKVVEQLRRDLLVKQDSAEIRLQPHAQLPLPTDGKTATLISNQNQSSLPPTHLNAPQNPVSVTPVIATKTLPLMLRAATPTTPIAMMPTPTIAMVTTLTNTPRPSLPNSDPQNSPVGLQTASKPANQGAEAVRIVPKNTIVVMPKTSVAPAALQPILASSQQPVLLTAKLSSALLPSTGPVHQLHIFNPQPGTATVPPGTTNATQPCPGSAQPGFNIIQPCPSITMTLSTNISQFNTSSTKHNAQLPSILISPQPSKPHAVSSAQANSDSANTGTPPTARSCEPCPNTPTPDAVDRVEPKTSTSSPAPCPVPLKSPVPPCTTSNTHTQSHTNTPVTSHTPAPKSQDNPLKLAFMLSLGLVTHDYLEEIQSKRQERKRRTTANPVYSGAVFEPERKKSTVSYLNSANQEYNKRANEEGSSEVCHTSVSSYLSFHFIFPPFVVYLISPRSPTQTQQCGGEGHQPFDPHQPTPRVCGSSLPRLSTIPLITSIPIQPSSQPELSGGCAVGSYSCDACLCVYHQDCLAPTLHIVPQGMWICPSCKKQILKKEEVIEWPGTLAIVHSYISYKAEREQEKQRLEKWSSELQQEREELELKAQQLSDSITICTESRNGVLARQREMEASIEKVKDLVRLIRGIQLPSLPQFLAMGITNGNPGTVLTQQPITTPSSEENQHPNRKNSTSFGSLSDVGNTFTDLRDTSNLHNNPTNTNNSISSAEKTMDTSETKNTSISRHGSITNTSPTLSNTHSQNTMCASSNGTLELEDGYEESKNQNIASDKVCIGDVNTNSIRDLRESVEPPLPTVMSMAEVVQGIE